MKKTTPSSILRHPRLARLLRLSPALLLLPACSSSNNASDAAGNSSAGNVIIKDVNNYTSTSTLTIPVIQTAAATDLTIDWSGIKKDLLCHTAGSIDNVAFLKIGNMTQADVEAKLALGKLTSTQVTTYKELHTATLAGDGGAPVTSTMLSKLSFGSALAPATDYTASATTQYLLLFTHGTTLGVGAQSMVFIQPTSGSQNVTVTAPDACDQHVLSFMPMLSSTPVAIPTAGPWKVDWSEITKDNFGNALDFSQTKLDKVELGFFMGKQPADVQADFLNVELDASSLYTYAVPLGQKYIDLAGTDADGGTFPGFTSTNGTWAVAVLCSTCSVPAPIVFATLAPQ